MAVYKRGNTWWYEFIFPGQRILGLNECHRKQVQLRRFD
jgi:hypothetical protein